MTPGTAAARTSNGTGGACHRHADTNTVPVRKSKVVQRRLAVKLIHFLALSVFPVD